MSEKKNDIVYVVVQIVALYISGSSGTGTNNPDSTLQLAGTGTVKLKIQADTDNDWGGDNQKVEFIQSW